MVHAHPAPLDNDQPLAKKWHLVKTGVTGQRENEKANRTKHAGEEVAPEKGTTAFTPAPIEHRKGNEWF